MSFDAYGASQNEGKQKFEVDWDALNQYIIETTNLENPETLIGVVSGIVDLGIQDQEDAEVEFTGTKADEAAEIAKNQNTYFKDGKNDKGKDVRLKCWPQKARQSVAIAVDFPDIMLDKGLFFGADSDPRPLRMWLGNEFYDSHNKMKVIGRPTPLKVTRTTDDKWSFAPNHVFYKMAVASKLIPPGEVFLPEHIDKVLGKAFQFEVRIFGKEVKGVTYLTERIKFVGGLGRGQVAPELPNKTFLIQFNKTNDPELLKEVRSHVINTIKKAKNYEGSPIQQQLEEVKPSYSSSKKTKEEEVPTTKVVGRKPKPLPVDNLDEDDCPF